jgi:catechol 2,3-dioxygenase
MTNSDITFSSTPLRIGKVMLTVNDLAGVSDFYQKVLGLVVIHRADNTVLLGAGGSAFLELVGDPQAPRSSPREAGLFHTAFLLPSRLDLGSWINHAAANRIAIQGASDHAVSEALYLSDPEGNGIEIYVDRPSSQWPFEGTTVRMVTDPLDMDSLRAAAADSPWQGAPAGTVIGHVHLQVGATAQADAFYAEAFGLDIMARYPGASFYGSGGYHHRLAGNIWNSRNAGPRAAGSTGLREVELLASDAATYNTVVARLVSAGVETETRASGVVVQDPWGTSLSQRQAEA